MAAMTDSFLFELPRLHILLVKAVECIDAKQPIDQVRLTADEFEQCGGIVPDDDTSRTKTYDLRRQMVYGLHALAKWMNDKKIPFDRKEGSLAKNLELSANIMTHFHKTTWTHPPPIDDYVDGPIDDDDDESVKEEAEEEEDDEDANDDEDDAKVDDDEEDEDDDEYEPHEEEEEEEEEDDDDEDDEPPAKPPAKKASSPKAPKASPKKKASKKAVVKASPSRAAKADVDSSDDESKPKLAKSLKATGKRVAADDGKSPNKKAKTEDESGRDSPDLMSMIKHVLTKSSTRSSKSPAVPAN